ncbi:MAG: tRNA (adenosine(37)-N6)-threonylcarbamoyltransferase complex ATPase subunit type 1 TsaE [Crocinitomicaceae bacterium]|nr:tRNA (adenosine(37)-N6)-threonylcarbamoyltransferase complex ATPase subunit type 1 TsaE [Crocinitomicaceae bacterium]|tara:strand:- start:12137 stop:12568 length:432 start_codon:yes stop_codon:yes gene_type:complete
MNSKHWTSTSLGDLDSTAGELLEVNRNYRVFAFVGKMGAGKTTFIKALCRSLGVGEEVSSPTFALVNQYEGRQSDSIFHFDFYRIDSEQEAFDIGFEEYLDSGNYCFIEWPDKVDNLLPEEFVLIQIKESEGKRHIESKVIID